MKVRYITEGVFKTKEQVLKAREKEREMSNQDRIVGTFNKVVGEKIAYLIKEAVRRKGIYPYQISMFSSGEHYEEVKTSKKEVTVKLEDDNGKQVIHLSFDYGCFVPSIGKSSKPCKDININGWVTSDYYNVRNKLIQQNALKSMVAKIKNFAASRGEEVLGREYRDICRMVVDGDIVIDEISMYSNQENVDELNFVIHASLSDITPDNFTSKDRRTACVREINQPDIFNSPYKVILERVMKLVDFKVPVNLIVEIFTMNNGSNTMTAAIDTVFPGYETLGDIEEAAGVPGAIANCVLSCFEFRKDRYAEGLYYDKERIQELARNCTYIMFDFEDTFKGRYTPDKGFILDKAEIPYIKDVVISADSTRYYSKFYVDFNFFKNTTTSSLYVNEYDKDKDNKLSFSAYSSVHANDGLARRIRNENSTRPFTIKEDFDKNDPNFKNVKTLVNFIETDLLGPAM